MPNPKHKISKARRDKRRANIKLIRPNLSTCPQCMEPKLPHYVCLSCGTYKGKEMITIKEV
jgi:large subunit ribosomal protein L32